jgi:hypothetical protein
VLEASCAKEDSEMVARLKNDRRERFIGLIKS